MPNSKIDQLFEALAEMARAYGLGTPESRAIMTAIEHARIVTGRAADDERREA